MSGLTRRPEVDDFDLRPFRIAEQHVFGLQVAMDYRKLGRGKEQKGFGELKKLFYKKFSKFIGFDMIKIIIMKNL